MSAEILLEASTLEEGTQTRIVCPTCGGGGSRERSLNISVSEGTILWNCHRATCNERGGAGDRGNFVRTKQPEYVRPKTTPYKGELDALPSAWLEYLQETIGWEAEHHSTGRAMYAPEEMRVAFPIFSPLGARRGWVLRSYDPFERSKALTYMDVEEPHMSWYRTQNNDSCVVVEDIPSAVRASLFSDSVALCGVGCNEEYAMEIAAHYDHVVWALDADATTSALELQRRYRLLFDTSLVMILDKDLKNESEEVLCQLLK